MPISLLLTPVATAFWRGVRGTPGVLGLEHWVELVRLEEVLIGRARGAFMVRWFGTRFPLQGSHLRGYFVNLDALRERFLAAQRSVVPETRGLNLLEPVAGLGGIALGVLLSPTSLLLAGLGTWRLLGHWAWMLGGIVLGPVIGALAAALGALALPLALMGALVAGLAQPESLRALHEVLGSVARLVDAFLRFMDVLTGPREGVRNPVVRGVLEILDGLARLVPLGIALFAVVVGRVGALVVPLTRQAVALLEVTDIVMDAIGFALGHIGEALKEGFAGPGSPTGMLVMTFGAIGRAFGKVGGRLVKLLGVMASTFSALGTSVREKVGAFVSDVKGFFIAAFEEHPVGAAVLALVQQIGILEKVHARIPPKPPKPPKSSSSGGSSLPSWLPSPPPFPALPSLPSTTSIAERVGGLPRLGHLLPRITLNALFDPLAEERPHLGPEALAALAGARKLDSVFARERRALERREGMEPGLALAVYRAREQPLRDAITDVVRSVLPPEIRGYLPELLHVFEQLDEALYSRMKERKTTAFPVKDLPDTGQLRPVVHRLHLRHPEPESPQARAFQALLVRTLGQQRYPAPAEP